MQNYSWENIKAYIHLRILKIVVPSLSYYVGFSILPSLFHFKKFNFWIFFRFLENLELNYKPYIIAVHQIQYLVSRLSIGQQNFSNLRRFSLRPRHTKPWKFLYLITSDMRWVLHGWVGFGKFKMSDYLTKHLVQLPLGFLDSFSPNQSPDLDHSAFIFVFWVSKIK